ncbi:hypothetical protein [Kiloniella sp. b19]|uniref:hypothetical protein n=1 Tax=Kiloniella sp. GXU_MW_B19 TaxID=3141326 RepID=UPI0031D9E303
MTNQQIVELVKWRGREGVSGQDMREAVDAILPDLESLPGFVSQTLYRDDEGLWVDLYVWTNREDAIASNDRMAPKESFIRLMELIEPGTVSIGFLNPVL